MHITPEITGYRGYAAKKGKGSKRDLTTGDKRPGICLFIEKFLSYKFLSYYRGTFVVLLGNV